MIVKSVLVSGMSGLIGQVTKRQLENQYDLTALNRRSVTGVPSHLGDIRDFAAIEEAFRGKDAVVHLAGVSGSSSSWEDVRDSNLIGTYNVFEASRKAGIKRVVYASSGGVVGNYERQFPYDALVEGRYEALPDTWQMLTHEDPPSPRSLYSCSKIWGEALAKYFSDTFGISILCLRFGRVTREDRPRTAQEFSIFCSQRDAGQIIEKALQAPDSVRYGIFFVLSNNKYSYRDIAHAQQVLGYRPRDAAENYRRK